MGAAVAKFGLITSLGLCLAAFYSCAEIDGRTDRKTARLSYYHVKVPSELEVKPLPDDLPQSIKDLWGPTGKWGNDRWGDDGAPIVLIFQEIIYQLGYAYGRLTYCSGYTTSRYWQAPFHRQMGGKIFEKDGKYRIRIEGGSRILEFWREGPNLVGELSGGKRSFKTSLEPLQQ